MNKSKEYTMQDLDKMTSTYNSVMMRSSSKPKQERRNASENTGSKAKINKNRSLSNNSKTRKTSSNVRSTHRDNKFAQNKNASIKSLKKTNDNSNSRGRNNKNDHENDGYRSLRRPLSTKS